MTPLFRGFQSNKGVRFVNTQLQINVKCGLLNIFKLNKRVCVQNLVEGKWVTPPEKKESPF